MSNNLNKPGIRAQARNLNSDMKEMQALVSRGFVGIERRLVELTESLSRANRVVNALTELVGAESVQEVVDRQLREEAENRAAAEKAALDEAIADGYAVKSDVVVEDSLIVAHETDGEGKPVGTGRQQLAFRAVEPSAQALLLGKEVGDKIETPVGGTFEIKEIYYIDREKAQVVLSAKAQKAAEAAAAADQKTDEATDVQASE